MADTLRSCARHAHVHPNAQPAAARTQQSACCFVLHRMRGAPARPSRIVNTMRSSPAERYVQVLQALPAAASQRRHGGRPHVGHPRHHQPLHACSQTASRGRGRGLWGAGPATGTARGRCCCFLLMSGRPAPPPPPAAPTSIIHQPCQGVVCEPRAPPGRQLPQPPAPRRQRQQAGVPQLGALVQVKPLQLPGSCRQRAHARVGHRLAAADAEVAQARRRGHTGQQRVVDLP